MGIITGKTISISIFVLILLCLFLPFFDVSCSGEVFATYKGMDLIVGKDLQGLDTSMFSDKAPERRDPEPLAIIAFSLAALGLLIAFGRGSGPRFINLLIGGLGLLLMFILHAKIESEVATGYEGYEGLVTVEWKVGYILTMILFPLAIVQNFLGMTMGAGTESTDPSVMKPKMIRLCQLCGVPSPADRQFCTGCGAPLNAPPMPADATQYAPPPGPQYSPPQQPPQAAPPQPAPPQAAPPQPPPAPAPAPAGTSVIYCEKCGTQSSVGVMFCSKCGAKLTAPTHPAPQTPQAPQAQQVPKVVICQLCDEVNPVGTKYCKKCGTLL